MTEKSKILGVIEKISQDQILLEKLCDTIEDGCQGHRIYQLMQQDIRNQHETYNLNYRRIL